MNKKTTKIHKRKIQTCSIPIQNWIALLAMDESKGGRKQQYRSNFATWWCNVLLQPYLKNNLLSCYTDVIIPSLMIAKIFSWVFLGGKLNLHSYSQENFAADLCLCVCSCTEPCISEKPWEQHYWSVQLACLADSSRQSIYC